MAINDITGDALISRAPSEAYKNNYDLIFRKKNDVADKDQKVMPTDYVIELAKQAGMQETFYIREELETFAALVREERDSMWLAQIEFEQKRVRADALEEAAKVCDGWPDYDVDGLAEVIRGLKCQ